MTAAREFWDRVSRRAETEGADDALSVELEPAAGGATTGGSAPSPEWERICRALRRANVAAVELDAETEELARLAEDAESLAIALEQRSTGKAVPLFGWRQGDEVNPLQPFSPVIGRFNPIAAPVEMRLEGERVVGRVCFGSPYQGAQGLVHGAVVAATYDDVLAMANVCAGPAGPTGRLTIHYRRPTPLGRPLRFEAWVDGVRGRRIRTLGRCLDEGGELLSEAEGIFVLFDQDVDARRWGGSGDES